MRTLDDAREVCEAHLPGLLAKLSSISMAELEKPDNQGLELFRSCGGPGLVIPKEYSGSGVTPLEAIQVTRAIGAVAPSLAVASTMHHFSVATVFTLAESLQSSGLEWALLEGIATQNLLVSSGFAEGNPGQGILSPTVGGVRKEGGIVVNGSKRPCSMSRSMDLLSASVSVPKEGGGTENVLMLIPAKTPGVSVHPFWGSNVLAGAESDEVRLTDVFVDDRLLVPTEVGERGELDELQTIGFMWFEMLITSCYLGMASALVERVFASKKLGAEQLADLGVRLETATLLLEGIARQLTSKEGDNTALTKTMIARYGAQEAIVDVASRAVEALGGMAFISSPEVAYLAAACQCVSFHPPSRSSTRRALAETFSGDVLRFG
ncbi:acyl-CoA dehydrogenase family protein [Umezawaea sp. Da 62-37]|uniref:acyl-CoA dehydrogenase family protein n=1 Tax=Umezawaea sp. Da 62-37 TaxID=3075927 RepID=UPI0028F6F7FA|nr:acyl-CoA dehydrogenase family protein [Umezawaea sp. Da 62-37]WNV85251.1 acyl-CoA dehydrogenase family protein [Umezawaea sp. Da 62-37]